MRKTAFIYCIFNDAGHAKIGMSVNPDARFRSLQTAHSMPLRLAWSLPVPRKFLLKAEKRSHAAMNDKRVRGEWFLIAEDEAKGIVAAAIEAVCAEPATKRHRQSIETQQSVQEVSGGRSVETDPFWIERARLTLEDRRKLWQRFDLPDPPKGFDDWYVCGSPNTGPMGAFPIKYGILPQQV